MIDSMFSWVVEHWFLTPIVFFGFLFVLSGFRLIPNNKVGIVEKRLSQAEAEKMRILGEGEAKKIQALANAQAEQTARVGVAQALAIEEQVRAYGGPRFQLTQEVMNRFAQAIETSRVDVVPKIVIGGTNGGGNGASAGGMSGNVMEALLAMLLSDKIGAELGPEAPSAPRNPDADRLRSELTRTIQG